MTRTPPSPLTYNGAYVEAMLEVYEKDPSKLSEDWVNYFKHIECSVDQTLASQGANTASHTTHGDDEKTQRPPLDGKQKDAQPTCDTPFSSPLRFENARTENNEGTYDARDTVRTLMMIRNYRVRGHLYAALDPLKLTQIPHHPELDPEFYGFHNEASKKRAVHLDGVFGIQDAPFETIHARLKKVYCGTIGAEFMHIQDFHRRNFIQDAMENDTFALSHAQRKRLFSDLLRAELFEKFLHKKFQGAKRFGLDGGESLIPALEYIIHGLAYHGVQHTVLGMAHRGRLNVLTHILGQPFRNLFAKFLNTREDPYAITSGDVKYHMGYSSHRDIDGKPMHLSLMSNPSHLEAVNPVVLGKVRAEQAQLQDDARKKVLGILIHGDAAFAGQGLVAESLELSDLPGYRTGGTIHIIINNQIGFTTSPPQSRSSPYCSDVAKVIQAPILHVNGDDPEAVLRACHIAMEYHHRFSQDVVIDLLCYRRFGHNESDEPSFTQPLMYKAIKEHPSTATLYERTLLDGHVVTQKDVNEERTRIQNLLEQDYDLAEKGENCFDPPFWLQGSWKGIEPTPKIDIHSATEVITGVAPSVLQTLGDHLFRVPDGFHINRKIARQFEAKKKMLESGKGFDWGTAEALAFGSLVHEGYGVRLSGQDCGRGTFSHRHGILVDQEDEKKYMPLSALADMQKAQGTGPHSLVQEFVDSPLAEASVLGFEYGYSSAHPHNLVLWEGQFGDFANGAQVMIDQFISSGEMKWLRQNGVVLLLPHGFEGQGPEHSSARLERFLQLSAEGNWVVANCSTPANYFHILRRQLKQPFRRPLVLMTPKSLLRHPLCTSSLSDFEGHFQAVIGSDKDPSRVTKVILCAGKIYYDIIEETHKHSHIAVVRLEQFYPWPHDALVQALTPYKHAAFVWLQEEPENMGGWHFVDRRLERTLKTLDAHSTRPHLIARLPAASPATGVLNRHQQEQHMLLQFALEAPAPSPMAPLAATRA